jgi:putative Ca2+/H+ antiporter (TMEM165/GDT1 family)
MQAAVVAAVFPVIFVGELPDKTMFASLVMASRGRPWAVWIGAALAFVVHVAIAVTIGVGLFHLLPDRAVDIVVALLFVLGAVWAFRSANEPPADEAALVARESASHHRTATAAFAVIFIAEWGDLTQVLTANLAARYQDGLSVAIGAVLALWAVAAIAVAGGRSLVARLSVRTLRLTTGVILLLLAAWTVVEAIRA